MAKAALDAAKDFLGIKSPSTRARDEIGKPTAMGVAEGLERFGYLATRASENMGRDIIEKMGKTISGLDKLITADTLDLQPAISPVLDLTDIERNASKIDGMLSTKPLKIEATTISVSQASNGYSTNQDDPGDDAPRGGDTYNFTQNNTSPKALSTADIYRQTKTVVARARKRGDTDAE
jgi:hypothetical protein